MVGTSNQSVPEMAIDKVFENLFSVQFPSFQWRSEVMVSDEQGVQSAKPIGGMILQVVPHSIRQKNMAIYVYIYISTNIILYIYMCIYIFPHETHWSYHFPWKLSMCAE